MRSMTGFSENSFLEKGIEYKCITKSLNSRFLEIIIKLPHSMKSNEGWIRGLIQKNFSRGKIELEIFYSLPPKESLSISSNLIKEIKRNEKLIKANGLGLKNVSYSEILRIKDLIQRDTSVKISKLKSLITKSIQGLKTNRVSDGEATKKDIQRLIKLMKSTILKIKKLEKQNIKQIRAKIKKYQIELEAEDKEINYNEAISAFGKSDINEEVVRFISHLELISRLINNKSTIGKKLDFYSQEMVREANTMSSKAVISEIKKEVVELKGSIEKIKEHAQNIE